MTDPQTYVSDNLRRIRKDRGWSLDRTAKETGVSKAMLGQIERGESSPTVATLWKIATGFEISFSSFVAPPAAPEAPQPTVVRDAAELRQNMGGGGIWVATLHPYDPALGFEVFEIRFDPGVERISEPHGPGITETILVVSGQLEFLADDAWHTLKPGQSIRLAGDRVHGYRNPGSEPALVHAINHYPKAPDPTAKFGPDIPAQDGPNIERFD